MYLNESELEARLTGQVQIKQKGNTTRGKALPDEYKALAGMLSNSGEKQKDIAEALGISQSRVSDYSKGLVDNRFSQDLHDKVTKPVEDRNKTIRSRAMDALANMVEQVANNAGGLAPDKASRIAVDMARISSTLSGGIDSMGFNKALIIVAPARNNEESYKTVYDVKGEVE